MSSSPIAPSKVVDVTKDHFVALDSWRGVCATLVAVHHFVLFSKPSHDYSLIHSFFLFVDFFFVLSGFVIASNYKDKISNAPQLLAFAIRRFGRVWPLHLVVMVAFIAVFALIRLSGFPSPYTIGASATTYSLAKFPLVLALTNSFGIYSGGWNLPSWSISAEFAAYLLYAAIFTRKNRFFLSVLALMCGAMLTWYLSRDYLNVTANFGVFRCIFGFGVGVVAYYVYEKLRPTISRFQHLAAWTVAELAAIALTVVTLISSVEASGEALPASFAAPFVFALSVFVFAFERGLVSRFLKWEFLTRIGGLSYSIYMTHWIILIALSALYHVVANHLGVYNFSQEQMWGGVYWKWSFSNDLLYFSALIIFIAVVFAISRLTFTLVEDPFRKRFSDLARKIK